MNFNFLILGEYSFFVWPAFIFAFLSFYVFYLNTSKKFKKLEKLYLEEFGQEQYAQINTYHSKEFFPKKAFF
jgi:heme exporter protein D